MTYTAGLYSFGDQDSQPTPVQQLGVAKPVATSNVDSTSREYWGNRSAGLIRSEWEDYKQRFAPVEDYYANLFLDPAKRGKLRSNAMRYVGDGVNRSYAKGLQSMKDRDARYGVGLSALEKKHRDRTMQAKKQAVLTKGHTDMNTYLDDREMQLLSGGVSSARTN